MAAAEDKENVAPFTSSDPLQKRSGSSSPKKAARKGRSKSIGPGGLDEPEAPKQDRQDAKTRRKSTYVPATKSILSTEQEKAERQAARRKTLANRRVSFAPEATLHTWDVIEFMRDQTTSTESSEGTRRASNFTRSSNGGSPSKRTTNVGSDPPSTPPEQEDEPDIIPASPAHQRDLHQKKIRRSSGASSQVDSSPSEGSSPSGVIVSSDASESEDEDDALGSDDDTGTAMSLDMVDENTTQSNLGSEFSTGSVASLDARLRLAAEQAGTRGIEYDEYGDASMELAGEEVTNAFKPWMNQHQEPIGSASLDQENVNPFSPAFKAQLVSGRVSRPSTVHEEDTGDLSMDVTRAVGGIRGAEQEQDSPSSQFGDGTMDLTQAVGKIQGPQAGQKRRRSTAETGSPLVTGPASQAKRRRSSVARSSMGDDTMDLTMAVGGIQNGGSPAKVERRKSVVRRRSSGIASEADDGTMDLTQAVGSIKPASKAEHTASSFDENEELTMELTTVLGGIKAGEKVAAGERPATPQESQSPIRNAANTTPKDQERFRDASDSGAKKHLTPLFQKQVIHSVAKHSPGSKTVSSASPNVRTRASVAFAESPAPFGAADAPSAPISKTTTPKSSPPKAATPSLSASKSPVRATANKSPVRERPRTTPDSALRQQLDEQLQDPGASPSALKVQRSSPIKAVSTPDKAQESSQDGRRLADSIKLLSTPRKEVLKSLTPRKQAQSPPKAATPRPRPTPKSSNASQKSPAKQLNEDMKRLQDNRAQVEKVQLQKFLDLASIRFMDLTTTKRRMTTAPTPSKARKADEVEDQREVSLESAVVAGSCTVPELEMYEHACHELKRYISDGKRVIKELDVETAKSTPPLLQAYLAASPGRKGALDSQMREIKTQARLRSKELWYAWRSQLLEDLMRGLQGIGEGLIRDDEGLSHAEEILEKIVPGLAQQYVALKDEAARLEEESAATNEEEREELEHARERLGNVSEEADEKRKMLADLQKEMQEQETTANDLEENRAEFAAAIQEAERVKESCRSVSTAEITALKGKSSVSFLLLRLKLFLHPLAFRLPDKTSRARPNAPISLHYTGAAPLTTTLRFFLQLLQASLQALPQCETRVPDLLKLVSNGWDAACEVAEAERRVGLGALTEAKILSDERMCVVSTILLPKVRSKVRITFEVSAAVGGDQDGLALSTTVEPHVEVVYGEKYNEKKMTEFVAKAIESRLEGWDGVVRSLRERLIARGAKGGKK
ncbi:uncharacterized protein LTR77_003384 [Saxophila tyrrhenica]|uniref:Spc7 kinetochore protein domain-containing protein n=1 Tax=Saxophila tyrrhenica TaxID=1690608 RepID=A0AAV9PG25_9PEZI|nr:hypothetical protein LTR77_003384 [Saxophila tyrrhenica]